MEPLSLTSQLQQQGAFVTCIPATNSDNDPDLAVAALHLTPLAQHQLHHPIPEQRIPYIIAATIHAHRLLPVAGYTYRCPSSR